MGILDFQENFLFYILHFNSFHGYFIQFISILPIHLYFISFQGKRKYVLNSVCKNRCPWHMGLRAWGTVLLPPFRSRKTPIEGRGGLPHFNPIRSHTPHGQQRTVTVLFSVTVLPGCILYLDLVILVMHVVLLFFRSVVLHFVSSITDSDSYYVDPQTKVKG